MEEIKSEEPWNKKRIFAVLFLIMLAVIGGYFFKTRVLDTSSSPQGTKLVKGISSKEKSKNTENDVSVDIQKAVKEKINSLKQEVSSLNIMEVASSSPQVQKIINDIKSLEQYPSNQVKDVCKKVCGGL